MVSAPIHVELVPHSPLWAEQAHYEAAELRRLLGPPCRAVHHVGSTAIPDILAKPVIDLLVEVSTLAMLDGATDLLARRGYVSWGEYGVPGRRYFSLDDPDTGRRIKQLHGFEVGHFSANSMIAFCAYLRAYPAQARAYERVKQECSLQHPDNSSDYSRAKDAWIRPLEATIGSWWALEH